MPLPFPFIPRHFRHEIAKRTPIKSFRYYYLLKVDVTLHEYIARITHEHDGARVNRVPWHDGVYISFVDVCVYVQRALDRIYFH